MRQEQPPPRLEPLPYQRQLVSLLKEEDPEVWEWFASHRSQDEQNDAVRLQLLRSTYRISREEQPEVYAAAEEAARSLDLQAPLTIYQAEGADRANASLAFVPGEIHLVLAGPLLKNLDPGELGAALAHEITHFALYQGWDGTYLVADRMLDALANDPQAQDCHLETLRLFRLYTEIFADRGALRATGDPHVAITALIKVGTGLSTVSATRYLSQAEEVLTRDPGRARELTHPETYIRARALDLWHRTGDRAEPEIERMIRGPLTLGRLDLLGQRTIQDSTRQLVDRLFGHRFMRTDALLAHARLFFDGYHPPDESPPDPELPSSDPELLDYFCFVLLDFATADRELEELPLQAVLELARRVGLADRLSELAGRELRLTRKKLSQLARAADQALAHADGREGAES